MDSTATATATVVLADPVEEPREPQKNLAARTFRRCWCRWCTSRSSSTCCWASSPASCRRSRAGMRQPSSANHGALLLFMASATNDKRATSWRRRRSMSWTGWCSRSRPQGSCCRSPGFFFIGNGDFSRGDPQDAGGRRKPGVPVRPHHRRPVHLSPNPVVTSFAVLFVNADSLRELEEFGLFRAAADGFRFWGALGPVVDMDPSTLPARSGGWGSIWSAAAPWSPGRLWWRSRASRRCRADPRAPVLPTRIGQVGAGHYRRDHRLLVI